MPDFRLYAGDTSQTVYFRLRDSTTGLGKTGILFDDAGATCSFVLPGAARVAITLATLASASAAWATGGFILADDTNCKGLYRLDLPDAAIASGKYTVISIEFDGIIEESMVIPLLTPAVNVIEWLGTAAATPDTAGYPVITIKGGTGTGELAMTSGVLDTVTTLTNLPAITSNWLTAAGINAGALDGKGDWSLASVVGALADAAAADEVTSADTLMQYAKQVVNILAGTPGIGTLKAAAAPASGVSLSEMIRSIYDDTNSLDGTKIPDTLSLVNINAEVDTALDTAIPELGVAAPTDTPSVREGIMLGYMVLLNKLIAQTSGTDALEIHNAAGTLIAKKLLTDDGSDYEEAKMVSG